jgi:deoxyadenosine/deoxycytidine kinase
MLVHVNIRPNPTNNWEIILGMKGRYIAIEGPIGVGKTALAETLADRFRGLLVREPIEENPFIEQFYTDMRGHAFKTQIFFLLSRYEQLRKLNQPDLFYPTTICDYFFNKDRIYAYQNLIEEEISLYENIYSMLGGKLRKPDLVIYLHASTETLIERMKKRNRPYEKNIDKNYLEDLVLSYNNYFFRYFETPLLVVNTSSVDFTTSEADLTRLVKEIKALKVGRKHYIPLGSK